jgi:hypothetical protein
MFMNEKFTFCISSHIGVSVNVHTIFSRPILGHCQNNVCFGYFYYLS